MAWFRVKESFHMLISQKIFARPRLCWYDIMCMICRRKTWLFLKFYIPSTLNIDLLLWHTQLIVCAENVKSWFKHRFFLSLFKRISCPYTELYLCKPISISYLNFRAVLVLPKTAGSAQTHKSMSFIWIVWSTLYVYLWAKAEMGEIISQVLWRNCRQEKNLLRFPDL